MANMYKSNLEVGGITPTGNATSADVLSGKTFMNSNGAQTGSMANNGAVSGIATPSQPYIIPEGYHNGLGEVIASGATGGLLSIPDDYIIIPTNGVPTISNGTSITNTHCAIINVTNRTALGCNSWQGVINGIKGTNVTALTTPSDPASTLDITNYDFITIISATRTFTLT